MKFVIDRIELYKAVRAVLKACTINIEVCKFTAKFEIAGEDLIISTLGNNYSYEYIVPIRDVDCSDITEYAVIIERLDKMLKENIGEVLTIEIDELNLSIKSDIGDYKLRTASQDALDCIKNGLGRYEYKENDSICHYRFNSKEISEGFKFTQRGILKNEVNEAYSQVCIDVDQNYFKLIGTEAHVMFYKEYLLDKLIEWNGNLQSNRYLINIPFANQIIEIIEGETTLVINPVANTMHVIGDNVLINGTIQRIKYVPYESLIGYDGRTKYNPNIKQLKKILSGFDWQMKSFFLHFKKGLLCECWIEGIEDGKQFLSQKIDCLEFDESRTVQLNPRYLSNVLNGFADCEIWMDNVKHGKGLLFTDGDKMALLMPIRNETK